MTGVVFNGFDSFSGAFLAFAHAEDGEEAVESGFNNAAEAEEDEEHDTGDHTDDDSCDCTGA